MSPASDPFFEVPLTVHPTSAGPVELPIRYSDVTNVVALFSVRAEDARRALEGKGLEPVGLWPGTALAGMSFYQYRRTSIGPYHEVGTALFAVRAGERAPRPWLKDLLRRPLERRVGMYVVDLPVSTETANAAGRELWGYPKFVTSLPFRVEGREVDAAVLDPGGAEICRLAGRMGPGVPAPPLSLLTFTHMDGALVRTPVDVRGQVRLCTAGTLSLSVGPSAHGMAARLRGLGLAGARPLVVLATDRFQSLLHQGARGA